MARTTQLGLLNGGGAEYQADAVPWWHLSMK
jgi:hypothetical protein